MNLAPLMIIFRHLTSSSLFFPHSMSPEVLGAHNDMFPLISVTPKTMDLSLNLVIFRIIWFHPLSLYLYLWGDRISDNCIILTCLYAKCKLNRIFESWCIWRCNIQTIQAHIDMILNKTPFFYPWGQGFK